jgi:hypothetical protein
MATAGKTSSNQNKKNTFYFDCVPCSGENWKEVLYEYNTGVEITGDFLGYANGRLGNKGNRMLYTDPPRDYSYLKGALPISGVFKGTCDYFVNPYETKNCYVDNRNFTQVKHVEHLWPENLCFCDEALKIPDSGIRYIKQKYNNVVVSGSNYVTPPKRCGDVKDGIINWGDLGGDVELKNIWYIGDKSFGYAANHSKGANFNFESGQQLKEIGDYSFYKARLSAPSGVKGKDFTMVLPDSLEYIGEWSFGKLWGQASRQIHGLTVPATPTTNRAKNAAKDAWLSGMPCSGDLDQYIEEEDFYYDLIESGWSNEYDSCLNISGNFGRYNVCSNFNQDYGFWTYPNGCYHEEPIPAAFSDLASGIGPVSGYLAYGFNEVQELSSSLMNLTFFVPASPDGVGWENIWKGNQYAVRTYDALFPSKFDETCSGYSDQGVYSFGQEVTIGDLTFTLNKHGIPSEQDIKRDVQKFRGGWRPYSFYQSKFPVVNLNEGIKYIPEKAFFRSRVQTSEVSGVSGVDPEYINEDGFYDGLYIPESTQVVEKYAFSRCQFIDDLYFGGAPRWIQPNAFSYCHGIENIVFDANYTGTYNTGTGDVSGAEPEVESGLCEMHIDDYAFSRCYNIKKVRLPRNLATIGSHAFWGSDPEFTYVSKQEDEADDDVIVDTEVFDWWSGDVAGGDPPQPPEPTGEI